MKICESVNQLIGNTPTILLSSYMRAHKLRARLCAKLEYFNLSGSIKDRAAMSMLDDAEKRGLIKPGAVIIEPTSGNTGIGLAAVGAARGYHVVLTMPDTMSIERRSILAAYGAEIVLTEGAKGMNGAIARAQELTGEIEGSFMPSQFDNPANAAIHRETTGVELWNDTDGAIDILVCGVGTGGTITGTGEYLKSKNPNIKVIAVEPANSPILSGGSAGKHGLQGIGAGFVPKLLDTSVYDDIVTVSDEDAYTTGRELAQTEGLLLGITSAAAVYAAGLLATLPENEGKLIVAIAPDTGMRYLSTPMFAE